MADKSIVKNILYKVVLNFFNIIVPVFIGSYALKVLGADNIGLVYHADSIYTYFFIFASFGIYQYGLREISRIRNNKDKLKSLFSSLIIITFFSNIASVAVFLLLAVLRYGNTPKEYVLIIYAFTLFSNIFFVEWANEALERYNFITIKTIIVKMIYVILLLIFVKKPEHYILYAVLIGVNAFLNNIISFGFIIKDIGFTLKGLSFKRHIKFLVISIVLSNSNLLFMQIDRLMLGEYVSDSAVSYYTISYNIVNMIMALITSIAYVTIPRLSNALGTNNENAYRNLLDKVVKNLCLFLFPSAVGIFVLAEPIIVLYSDLTYISAVPVLMIFCILLISLSIEYLLCNQVIYAKRNEKKLILFMIPCGLINIILKFVLIKLNYLSPTTAVISTALCHVLLVIIEYIYCSTVLGVNIKIYKLDKLRYLLIALLFIPISYVLKSFIQDYRLIAIVSIVIDSSLYAGILYIIKDEIFMNILKKIQR